MVYVNNLLFKNGKNALLAGLKYCDFDSKSGIIIPKFICDDLVVFLKKIGLKIFYYDLDYQLNPRLQIINSQIIKKNNIKIFLLVHYFGYYFESKKVQNFCKKYNLLFIEDNSHGYGSKYKGRYIGTHSDFSFSSPHKTIPETNAGGNLIIKKLKLKKLRIVFDRENSYKKFFFKKFSCLKNILIIKNLKNYYENLIEKNNYYNIYKIDSFNNKILKSFNLNEYKFFKKKSFNCLKNLFHKYEKDIMYFNYDKGTIPWFFCFLYKNNNQKKINDFIKKKNLNKIIWPAKIPQNIKNDQNVINIKKKLFIIKLI